MTRRAPIYYIRCQGQTQRGQCIDSYIGETEKTLKTRFLEHVVLVQPRLRSHNIFIWSPLTTTLRWKKSRSWTGNRDIYFERGVKEPVYIRVNQPSLNKDGDRYKLLKVTRFEVNMSVRSVTSDGLPVS